MARTKRLGAWTLTLADADFVVFGVSATLRRVYRRKGRSAAIELVLTLGIAIASAVYVARFGGGGVENARLKAFTPDDSGLDFH